MKAKLFLRKKAFTFYTMDQGEKDGDEVWSFLNESKKKKKIAGFFRYMIEKTAAEGLAWIAGNDYLSKKWPEGHEDFHEFRHSGFRISYFVRGKEREIYLITVFQKGALREEKEYRRATKLWEAFIANPKYEG